MIPDDPIPTIRRYHTDPAFHAEIEAQRQAHYDAFYASTSAAIDRANPRTDPSWLVAAHEAGRADPDPFYERTDNERHR